MAEEHDLFCVEFVVISYFDYESVSFVTFFPVVSKSLIFFVCACFHFYLFFDDKLLLLLSWFL